jgi:adenylate kinase
MVIFFGPAGAGKSVQGQILAARQGWRWLSMGQLLRDTGDIELYKTMQKGGLVPSDKTNHIISDALDRSPDINMVIIDGYPRKLDQAEWLVNNKTSNGDSIGLVVVLEVPRSELMHRLELRGRVDDTPDAINERLLMYKKEIYPILSYFTGKGINIVHIDGTGTVGQVHDRIIEELVACKLV